MTVQKFKMIDVLFDNNAFQILRKSKDYESNVLKIEELFNEKKLQIHFNLHVFLEQIEGTDSKKAFEAAKKTVNEAGRICQKHFIMPTEIYLKMAAGILSTDEIKSEGKYWMGIFSEFNKCKTKDEFNRLLGGLKNYSIVKKKDILKGFEYVREASKQFKIKNNISDLKLEFQKNKESLNKFRRIIFDAQITRYNLIRARSLYVNDEDFVKKMIALCYITNIYICYFLELSSERVPEKSDYADIEQTAYLDGCDYIVTEDKVYYSMINNCPFSQLEGRALTLNQFIENLYNSSFFKMKKAPLTITEMPTN